MYINIYVYINHMSHLVNISDDVYDELTLLKKMKSGSYTEVIDDLLHRLSELNKTIDWKTMISNAKTRDAKFKGKKEKIDYDLVAYGVSRDRS